MTPEALPTPYDITPLPALPFVPGVLLWAALLVLAALVTLCIAGLPQRKRRVPDEPAIKEALATLTKLETSALPPGERLALSSLAARRLLTTITGADLRSLTAAELPRHPSVPSRFKAVAEATAQIEAARFSPTLTKEDASALGGTLVEALSELARNPLVRGSNS